MEDSFLTLRRHLEGKFREGLEFAPDAMIIADRTGRISLVNSQMEKLFGYSRQELFGQRMEILMPVCSLGGRGVKWL